MFVDDYQHELWVHKELWRTMREKKRDFQLTNKNECHQLQVVIWLIRFEYVVEMDRLIEMLIITDFQFWLLARVDFVPNWQTWNIIKKSFRLFFCFYFKNGCKWLILPCNQIECTTATKQQTMFSVYVENRSRKFNRSIISIGEQRNKSGCSKIWNILSNKFVQ